MTERTELPRPEMINSGIRAELIGVPPTLTRQESARERLVMARLFRKLAVLAGATEAARRYARKNPEKVARLAENAGRFVDKKTHGKYHSKIEGAVRKVRGNPGQRPV
ncbi:hypothetical protein JOF56_006660 [Kibdelosporangium banguiense]|uniref:Uncharacterized protein n=1 Tax=Kibdelosporangium banguiense TaxID=1365924 RepID=A0ABS4TPE6_9PSEU|nr:antitoxin [Kibdelosporangium banguiense]MBP2326275.1 hypothetical protein [Kibdelosporangium banguiense]